MFGCMFVHVCLLCFAIFSCIGFLHIYCLGIGSVLPRDDGIHFVFF